MSPSAERITTCRSCNGSGRTGFMGVARIPCWRCKGSGKDPRSDEPLQETTYCLSSPAAVSGAPDSEEKT
jgi:DnaJ-class molecular chaperone